MATLIIINSYFYIIKQSYDFNTILFIKYLVFLGFTAAKQCLGKLVACLIVRI